MEYTPPKTKMLLFVESVIFDGFDPMGFITFFVMLHQHLGEYTPEI